MHAPLLVLVAGLGAPEPPGVPAPVEVPAPRSDPETPDAETMQWSAPASCPDVTEFRASVERRLGRALVDDEVKVEARVEATTGGYRLALRTVASGVTDTRTFEAGDCTTLVDAAGLVVALAVDPLAVAARVLDPPPAARDEFSDPVAAEPTVTTVRTRGSSVAPGVSSGPVTRRADARMHDVRPTGLFRVGVGVGLGVVPRVSGAVSAAAGLRWRRARLELEGSYWIPRVAKPIGPWVRVQLGTVAVRGCGQLARERFDVVVCAGPQIGRMGGHGVGTRYPRRADAIWFSLNAGVAMSWWFRPRWALAGGLDVAVPVVRPAFELAGAERTQLYTPASVSGRLWLGIEVRTRAP